MTDAELRLLGALEKTGARFPHFRDFVETQNELIASGTSLLSAASQEEDYQQYLRLVAHVERLRGVACDLYHRAQCAESLFLAIVALEEVGKVGVARFQLVLREAARKSGVAPSSPPTLSRRGNPFYSHTRKHLLAAGAGAVVNARLDRLLGRDRVESLLEDIRDGRLEMRRQSALYADVGPFGPKLPEEEVSAPEALFYVVVAGEVMAEVLGFEPPEWERMLEKVKTFERAVGHPWE